MLSPSGPAWHAHRQGLDGSLKGATADDVLAKAGWVRSVGGVNPYLALYARASVSPRQAEAAMAEGQIQELPSLRGCTYVVPTADAGYALALAGGLDPTDQKAARSLGVTDAELERLEQRVLDVLGNGPADPKELRPLLGDAVRSLGEEGKKKGVTSTLPVALGRLQAAAAIRRIPANGRLDTQRFRYALWLDGPSPAKRPSPEEARAWLAAQFFGWAGPAQMVQFRRLAGLTVKEAQAAVSELALRPIAEGSDWLIPASRFDEFRSFSEAPPRVHLVGSLDNLFHLRRDLDGLVEPSLAPENLTSTNGLVDLPSHAIVWGGRLVGLWEFDASEGEVVWRVWDPVADLDAVRVAVAEMERLVREELGDAPSFSLDSPKARAPKVAALRAARG